MDRNANKSLLTVGGVVVLERIMRSCPPTASNGGKAMKAYLAQKVKEIAEREHGASFSEITEKFHSLRKVVLPYDVYADLENNLGRKKANFWNIVDFFAGLPHINQAEKERNSEDIAMLDEMVKDKYFFAHVLSPILLTGKKGNVFEGVYRNGGVDVAVRGLRVFPEDKGRFSVGITVLAHYACIIDEIGESAAESLLGLQKESKRFVQACESISKSGIDHSEMAYGPWCESISLKAKT